MSLDSAVSSSAIVYEEYGADSFILLSSAPKDLSERVRGYLESLAGEESVREERVDGLEGGRPVERVVEAVAGGLAKLGCRGADDLIIVVSPASRLQAAAMGLSVSYDKAWERREVNVRNFTVVHVSFHFGPWTGLQYPYVPRGLQPLTEVHPGAMKAEPGTRTVPSRAPALRVEAEQWGHSCTGDTGPGRLVHPIAASGSLPPLRCLIAETARRINEKVLSAFRHLETWDAIPAMKVAVEISLGGARSISHEATIPLGGFGDQSNLERLERGLRSLADILSRIAGQPGLRRLSSLVAWTGVAALRASLSSAGSKPMAMVDGPVIVDTNLIYAGIHVYAWDPRLRGRILLPECAVNEVERAYAEALKELKGGGRPSDKAISAGLAYLALEELRAAGAKMIPSPPGPCDTSIPKIDAVILRDSIVATSDSGAYRFWMHHPSSRIVRDVAQVSWYRGSTVYEALRERPREAVAYSVYAAIQSLIALCLLEGLTGSVKLAVNVEASKGDSVHSEPLKVPCISLVRALGWEASGGRALEG
jgi:hypothetical protein